MSDVRGQRVDLPAVGVERDREVLAVLDPEIPVEPTLEIGRFLLKPLGECQVVPDGAGQAGSAHLGVVGIPLQLAGRSGKPGSVPSRKEMESHESFQHWFSSPVFSLRRL